jgi:hypothetical protein
MDDMGGSVDSVDLISDGSSVTECNTENGAVEVLRSSLHQKLLEMRPNAMLSAGFGECCKCNRKRTTL